MAKANTIVIENLRKKSRELLSKLESNSKIVEKEIEKLHSQTLLSEFEEKNESKTFQKGVKDCWNIRNDSSSVFNLLCPELFNETLQTSPKASADIFEEKIVETKDTTMTIGTRTLLKSKRPCVQSPLRKPIQGCYRNEQKKVQPRSARTLHKPSAKTCMHCQSNIEIVRRKAEADDFLVSPALSCETFRRVQNIRYTPRSEFLKRVQKKIALNFNYCQDENRTSHLESPNEEELDKQRESREGEDVISKKKSSNDVINEKHSAINSKETDGQFKKRLENIHEIQTLSDNNDDIDDDHRDNRINASVQVHRPDESPRDDEITRIHSNLEKSMRKIQKAPMTLTSNKTSKQSLYRYNRKSQSSMNSREEEYSGVDIVEILPPRKNHSKLAKKTIPSKSSKNKNAINNEEENSGENSRKNLENTKKPVRVLSQKSCCYDCCSLNAKRKTKSSKKLIKCCDTCLHCIEGCMAQNFRPQQVDKEAMELQKFREKNYFDTHGSKNNLSSSNSSGSLEHFELNDRLFPESVERIHRSDVVVSMPPCATKQLKRIHYFPRNIVYQHKNEKKSPCLKKRRYHNCHMIGHAIDLGILEVQRPTNSLALKYQKSIR